MDIEEGGTGGVGGGHVVRPGPGMLARGEQRWALVLAPPHC